jgi:hypothetical protein
MNPAFAQAGPMAPYVNITARILTFAAASFGFSLSLAEAQDLETPASPAVRIEVQIEERKILGDEVIRVTQGQIVEMVWTTDEETEVHIHGYEIHIPTSPDAPAEVIFEAHATGRYPVTSHGFGSTAGKTHQMLLYFEVHPK